MGAAPLIAGTAAAVLGPAAGATEAPGVHVVERGETLSELAVRHRTTTAELVALNGLLNADTIRIGQSLRLPATSPTATVNPSTTASPGAAQSYQVKPGDTLSEIAASVGVSADALARHNGIANPHLLWSGQVLDVPSTAASSTAASNTAASSPAATVAAAAPQGVSHTVAAGESLSAIAGRYGVSVDRLVVANGIRDPNLVVVGQRLAIPALLPVELFGSRAGSEQLAALVPVFEHWATSNGIAPELLMAVTFHESGWHGTVESPVGAIGIGQIMPDTAVFISGQLIGVPLDPHDPEDNIRMSARYLGYLIDQTGGDTRQALAGYYQGLSSVRSRGWYDDTKQYVANVEALVPWFR